MSAAVETLLKAIQNAVAARALYPAEHPRTREGIARIEKQVRDLTLSGRISPSSLWTTRSFTRGPSFRAASRSPGDSSRPCAPAAMTG